MSEPVAAPGRRAWRFLLDDMRQCVANALAYTQGMDQAAFEGNRMVYDATVRNIELIGEAARGVPTDVQARAPDVPWRQLVATRNRLIHGYAGIDNDTLWSILRDDLPRLSKSLEALIRVTGAGPER
jgi:uncharacterized protein with HEPN domain